jgi:CheY-like chemotaxis protein
LLAGRKLLLADDSITIQKVVDLTFADEGVEVVCVNNGREAIERLEEFLPDVVLADVFMPQTNGYEVCEYIKQNDKLKHIPVMLLVGSFEPFDEEEARRVGANDTLTKPFQSIRRLMEKVGLLVSERPPEEQIPTAELPKPEVSHEPEEEKLTEAELEITTADTQPLPPELRHVVEEASSRASKETERVAADAKVADVSPRVSQSYEGAGEVLLDLGDYAASSSSLDDDFVLDIDLDEVPEPSPVDAAFPAAVFRSRYKSTVAAELAPDVSEAARQPQEIRSENTVATADQLAKTQEFHQNLGESGDSVREPAREASLDQLSPEMIDAIARRAVEHLSEKVVEEIAWEVVPQLAELMIRKQLEEKSS